MRIAEFGESRNPRTHPALSGLPGSMPVRASFPKIPTLPPPPERLKTVGRGGGKGYRESAANAVSWERGAPPQKPPSGDEGSGAELPSRAPPPRVQTLIGSVAPRSVRLSLDRGIVFRVEGRRPWSVRPQGRREFKKPPPLSFNHDLGSGKITR